MKIDGGCHCGFIRYEGEADTAQATICHCADCQQLTGSAFRTAVPVKGETFRIVAGEPAVYVKTAESGNKREQAFCPRCGSPIFSATPGDKTATHMIRLGTVRQRDQIAPMRQIWMRSRQPWLPNLTAIPGVEKE